MGQLSGANVELHAVTKVPGSFFSHATRPVFTFPVQYGPTLSRKKTFPLCTTDGDATRNVL